MMRGLIYFLSLVLIGGSVISMMQVPPPVEADGLSTGWVMLSILLFIVGISIGVTQALKSSMDVSILYIYDSTEYMTPPVSQVFQGDQKASSLDKAQIAVRNTAIDELESVVVHRYNNSTETPEVIYLTSQGDILDEEE